MSTDPIALTSQVLPIDIKITLQHGTEAVPEPIPVMKVGQKVRYVSDDGEVTIMFPDRSPFRLDDQTNTTVQGGEVLLLLRDSMGLTNDAFICRCFLKLPNGETAGWKSDPSPSGGEHHVHKP